jgi:hypothetical protein
MNKNGNKPRWNAAVAALLLCVLAEYALCALVHFAYHPVAYGREYFAAHFAVNPDWFRPKPVERLQYVLLLLTLPFFLYGFYAACLRFMSATAEKLQGFISGGALCAGIFFCVMAVSSTPYVLAHNFATTAPGLAACAAVFAFLWFYGAAPLDKKVVTIVACAFAALCAVCAGVMQIFGPQMLDSGSMYGMHFSAVFHSVAQVYMGKSLLVDFPDQYGLYPFLLKPVLWLTGLSVLRFTVLLACLTVLCYSLIFSAARKLLQSGTFAALAACAVMFLSLFQQTLHIGEYYFQAVPLRMLFPAAAALLSLRYFYGGGNGAYYVCAAVCAFAPLWNFDTGFVCWLSWLLALGYAEISRRGWNSVKPVLKHCAILCGMTLVAFGIFAAYTRFHSGQWPDIPALFLYMGYFYGSGFNMVPMSIVHAWNIPALIYAGGLLFAAVKLYENEPGPLPDAVFMLSVLGCGIFAYFQGRSVTPNLFVVCWPAVLLAVCGAKWLFSRPGRAARFAAAMTMTAVIMCAFSAAQGIPLAARNIHKRIMPALRHDGARFITNLDFMRANIIPGEKVLVISYNSSAYHLYAGTNDPLRLPGLSELYLNRDIDALAAVLREKKYPLFWDAGAFTNHTAYAGTVLQTLKESYNIVGESQAGMSYCLPKRNGL